MIPQTTDVLVIGGGPAGATVSAILAKQGIQTTVLEREAFPRYHIGESLLASLIPILDLTGVHSKVRGHGFVQKPGGYFDWGMEKWSFVFDELKGIPTHSYQVIRAEFDDILLTHAAEQGAEVHQRVRVNRVNFDGERAVSADYDDRVSERSGTVRFRYVIDCSGRSGLIGNEHLKARRYHHSFKNIAVWSYWNGAALAAYGLPGSTRLFSIENGWLWFIPLHDHTVSVGLVLSRDQLKIEQPQHGIEEIYEQAIRRHPEAATILKEATHGGVTVETDYSYTADKFSGPGYFMCGDAACFLDPLLSTGVHLAMVSALVAGASVTSLLRGEVTEERAANFFEASYRRAYLRFLMLVSAFYDLNRGKTGYFWEAQRLTPRDYAEQDLKKAFINVVAGTADFDDLKEGNYSEAVTRKFSERLHENIGIHHQESIDVGSRQVKDNARFFDAINGIHVLTRAEAIDGLYVATSPAIALAEVK
jgi:flavin-dependent dehydrogenase